MRCLVTGGAGFIGSHLVRALLDAGHEVCVQDDLCTGSLANLDGLPRERLSLAEADLIEGVAFDGPFERIYNLASPASPADFERIPLRILRVGSDGVRHVLELAERTGARLLQASTSEVYGDPLVHPQPESYLGNVNTLGVRGAYDESKRFAEAQCAAYQRLGRADVRLARIFNTYGPHMRLDDGRVVPNFLCQALRGEPLTLYGDGSQTRSFCYVSDQVAGLMALMESDVTEPVNVGNPDEVTIREFAERVVEVTGSASRIETRPLPHADDPQRRRPDITRARERLGWEPRVGLREGLTRTLEDFRARLGKDAA